MVLFLVWGSDAHRQLQTATAGNEPEEARKLAQSVEQANRIVESWLLSNGGRFIAYEGGNGSAEIDASRLGDVKEILAQFSMAIQKGRVWAGVGAELKEADVAAQVAYRRGGENTIVLYTPEIAQELEEDDPELTSDDMLVDRLTKFDEQAPAGEATAVERGQAAPPSPMSIASQGASQLPDIPGQENRPSGPAQPGQPQNQQQLKQAIVEVLKDIRSQVPFFDKVKEQNPAAYQAVMGLVEAMLSLAQQVMGQNAPTAQDAGLGKAEAGAPKAEPPKPDDLQAQLKPARKLINAGYGVMAGAAALKWAHHLGVLDKLMSLLGKSEGQAMLKANPQLAQKLAVLAKALRPRVQGTGHFYGPLENFDASAGLGKEEPQGEEHQFEEVSPEEYESVISSRPDQGGLAQDRDYVGKKAYLNKQRTAGVTVDPRTGELQYLFSLVRGHGVPAMRFGIKMGGTNLDCFDGGLTKLYGKHGWKEVRREANWTPGGPDVVFMRYQPDAPKGVEPPLRRSEKLAKMAKIHDNARKPMMVWRIQNEKGEGPYNSSSAPAIVPDEGTAQPDPEEDFTHQDQAESGYTNDTPEMVDWFEGRSNTPVRTKGPKFAFLKPEHAAEWFGKDTLAQLASKGFKLVQVPAAQVWSSESGKQVMYHPAAVKKHDELDPTKPPPKGTRLVKDALPGGLADRSDPRQFPKDLLREGAQHEMEHTDDPRIATEIAMDHLKEDPLYYRKLKAAGLDKAELAKKAPPGVSEKTMHQLKAKYGVESAFKIAWAAHNKAKKSEIKKDEPAPNPTHHNLQLPVGTVLNGTGRQGGGAARAKAGIVIETNAEGKKVHRQQRRGRRAATNEEGGASESAQNTPPPTEQPGPTERKGTAIGDGQG